MRFIYATDMHGNRKAIEQTLSIATEQGLDAVVFGGDLTPKSFAIKLPKYESDQEFEESGSPKEVGGELIPFDLLKADQNSTYLKSLRAIQRLNARQSSDQLQAYYEDTGTAVFHETSRSYEIDYLILEQQLLSKLCDFFNPELPNRDFCLEADEWCVLEDCVAEWMRDYESQWDERTRSAFVQDCMQYLTVKSDEFAILAPSKHLVTCLVHSMDPEAMRIVLESLLNAQINGTERATKLGNKKIVRLYEELLDSIKYKHLIKPSMITELVRYTALMELKNKVMELENVGFLQADFLVRYFLPTISSWRKSNQNTPVYTMLGNDDMIENRIFLEEAHRDGVFSCMQDRFLELNSGLYIVGYGHVTSLPESVEYQAWWKSEEEVATDLESLRSQSPNGDVIWSIHNPPYKCLDQCEDSGSVGSKAIRAFLEKHQPKAALFGHIHEAARLAGTNVSKIGTTLCVNPGAEHSRCLHAVIIDTESWTIESVSEGEGRMYA